MIQAQHERPDAPANDGRAAGRAGRPDDARDADRGPARGRGAAGDRWPDSPAAALPAAALGVSPQRMYDMAWSDYTAGQWDLAIQGFESYIRSFPKSDLADDAQVLIGAAYMMKGENQKAVDAFDAAIRTYPAGDKIPDAYLRKGVALQNLKQLDAARQAWETVAKLYPDSDAGRMAKQRLEQMKR